jgi:UDP-N-acetylglucosamine 2-epimerase (non-hydrolysing)
MIEKPSLWFVVGTRPEAIKILPIVHALRKDGHFDVKVCSTGQHREMLKQVLAAFDIKADIELDVMQQNQTLTTLTTNILLKFESAIAQHGKPDRIIVHGDTSSAFCSALAAFYNEIPVAHVEAGLRTLDLSSPFPEEGNRQLVKVIADMHFAPTMLASQNLVREGVPLDRIFITGNTVIDALLWMQQKINKTPDDAGKMAHFVEHLGFSQYILVTGHRRESHGDGFQRICDALEFLANKYPETAIVYPVHMNPKVMGPVKDRLGHLKNVKLIAPQEYAPFVYLMSHAHIILTDSGGVQEEAPSLNVPVLVMRDTTERTEAIESGTVKLVGTQTQKIVDDVSSLMDSALERAAMTGVKNPYGDGDASERIVGILKKHYNLTMKESSCKE